MNGISETDLLFSLVLLFLAVAVGRGFGDLARRVGQPEILGQLFAGFLLGPSVFGLLAPTAYHALFNSTSTAALSVFSWIGAILLLLIAGTEIDLRVLRRQIKPSALAAAGAIGSSLIVGSVFALLALGRTTFMLGIVLSVTGTSVVTPILVARGIVNRRYAQVILAAGVASEALVWLLVSMVSSGYGHSRVASLVISAAAALGFIIFTVVIARPVINWSMRRMADQAPLRDGLFSLVVTFTLLASITTQLLGLHLLLGAFVVGLVLAHAPRYDATLSDHLHGLTTAFFAPIFFVVAGTRVNLLQLHGISAIGTILVLLVVATLVKVLFAALGAWLGGLRAWSSLLVGAGLNLKGGTDVIVAIIGVELHLLSVSAYTMYAVVAMLTVLFSPVLIGWLAKRVSPTSEERERLHREAAARHAYVALLERVLIPLVPALLPTLSAQVARWAAAGRQRVGEPVDIIEVMPEPTRHDPALVGAVSRVLREAEVRGPIHVLEQTEVGRSAADAIMTAAQPGDLIAIGARPPHADKAFTLGNLQDALIGNGRVDVLVTLSADDRFDCRSLKRILVPVNGLEYSVAGADVGGLMAAGCTAEVDILTVMQPGASHTVGADRRRLQEAGDDIVHETTFRLSRFDVPIRSRVVIGQDVAVAIARELEQEDCQLLVMGGKDRGRDGAIYLGGVIEQVVRRCHVQTMLYIAHSTNAQLYV